MQRDELAKEQAEVKKQLSECQEALKGKERECTEVGFRLEQA